MELSAIAQGVKLIGIGKHGSKKLPQELITKITNELKQKQTPEILKGAFFGALLMKDIEPYYIELEDYLGKGTLSNTSLIWNRLFADTPDYLQAIGIKLLNKKTLTIAESTLLGGFLFSDEPGECFRGMAVSVLRIRYETDDEYKGLYDAIISTAPKTTVTFNKQTTIQLAEPFDGVEHSFMITPLLAHFFQQQGYNVVLSCGRNGGPKFTLNTLDLLGSLQADFLSLTTTTQNKTSKYGWVLNQQDFFPHLDAWAERRKVIMKRPFMATLEKVLNPVNADVLITSVFHIPYLEKMIELGFMSGFKSVIVLKRGLEGSLAPSLAKATGILCGVKNARGEITIQSFDANENEYSSLKIDSDLVIENLSVENNKVLIEKYLSEGSSGDNEFDARVDFAKLLFTEGLTWINNQTK